MERRALRNPPYSGSFRPILEQVAFDHAVVKLPLFVRGPSKRLLKLRVGAQMVETPVRRVTVGGAEFTIERLGLLLFEQPLAIGRVRNDDAALRRTRQGLASYALAEYNLALGNKKQAESFAKRAAETLPEGMPAQLRAEDILQSVQSVKSNNK